MFATNKVINELWSTLSGQFNFQNDIYFLFNASPQEEMHSYRKQTTQPVTIFEIQIEESATMW